MFSEIKLQKNAEKVMELLKFFFLEKKKQPLKSCGVNSP